MRVFVLGTGSSGNALVVDDGTTRILVDAGISPRAVATRMSLLGAPIADRKIDAVVATHHHADHFAHAEGLARAFHAPLYLHRGIDAPSVRRRVPSESFAIGGTFRVGSLEVRSERVPHDAVQVALRIASPRRAIGIATDVGRVTPELVRLLGACDTVIAEANFCPDLLDRGAYPPHLKDRMQSGFGHLSNLQAAELGLRLSGSRVERLWLAHLSRANNTPGRAREVVTSATRGILVDVLPHGAVCALDVSRTRFEQLGLFAR